MRKKSISIAMADNAHDKACLWRLLYDLFWAAHLPILQYSILIKVPNQWTGVSNIINMVLRFPFTAGWRAKSDSCLRGLSDSWAFLYI